MRLLNCSTLKIEEFFGTLIPKSYAILSHRWEADEVTYQDVTENDPQKLERMRGWAKIRETCRVAKKRGYAYAWIDTCCIDKRSSTELSEAINSMFKWYADAAVCFAFLSDVGGDAGQPFAESLWFTRGWTLQELVAPREMLFFDRNWTLLGTRDELCGDIHRRTGVSEDVLLHGSAPGPGPRSIRALLSSIPVAVRMSWAAGRVTAREEDRAYSLLGIFGVNMPMVYGEGSGAFVRLQEEIMKHTTDLTLFAWTEVSNGSADQKLNAYRGILATSPDEFRDSGKLALSREAKSYPESTMTNQGLRLVSETTVADHNLQILGLGCHDLADGSKQQVGIYLKAGGDVFLRAKPQTLVKVPKKQVISSRTIYIEKHVEIEVSAEVTTLMTSASPRFIWFTSLSPDLEVKSGVPASMWDQQKLMFIPGGDGSFAGYVHVAGKENEMAGIVACGFDREDRLWLCAGRRGVDEIYDVAVSGDMERLQELGIQHRRKRFFATIARMDGLEASGLRKKRDHTIQLRKTICTVM